MRETIRRESAAALAASRSLEVVLAPGTITNIPVARARTAGSASSSGSGGSGGGGAGGGAGGGKKERRRGRDVFTRAGGFRVPDGPVFTPEALSGTILSGPKGVGMGATLLGGGGGSTVKLPALPGAAPALAATQGKPGAFGQKQVAVILTPAG